VPATPAVPPPPPPPPPSAPPPPALGARPASVAPPPPDAVPADALVVAQNVSKWFGDLVAVSDVSFHVRAGVTALLGPNGAGKSTMMRMLCGLTAPSIGTVRVLGRDPRHDLDVTGRIGIVPQQDGVFEMLTAYEFVRLAAVLQGLPDPDTAARQALHLVEIDADDTRRLPTYSKGMRQRVKLAQALVHDPQVIVLDEPLTGLDPRQRIHMIDLVHRLGGHGRAVIVSSHVLEEVERFGSRVLVIAQGRLAAVGDFHAIRDLMDDRPLRIRVRTDRPRALASLLLREAVVGVRVEGTDTVIADTVEVARFRRSIAPLAQEAGARLFEVAPLDDDLESVFRYLVDPAAQQAPLGRTSR
jgi:ABC-2 type transport system ATP-binding protein